MKKKTRVIIYILIIAVSVIFLAACSSNNKGLIDKTAANSQVRKNVNEKETLNLDTNKESETELKRETIKEQEQEYKTITPQEAKTLLTEEENIVLLDVRTEDEYSDKHIPNSMLIPLNVLKDEAENKLIDKEQVILIYCRSGNRSKTASHILLELGYKNVYDLGGIKDWPYEIESNR